VKRFQCTDCGQIFWTDLQIDEALVSSGEWVQNPCPKCGVLWAVVDPEGVVRPKRGRTGKPGEMRQRRRGPSRAEVLVKSEEKEPTFSGSEIRRLRKKLKLSQKELGSLLGVSASSIISWEKGKFRPRKDKVAQLSDLAKKGKEEVRSLLGAKEPKRVEEKPGKVEEPKVKRKRGIRRKAGREGRKKKL
jgi:DNA-binding transcriptional regulator YiaG